jgi:hypothetical protein
LLWCYVLYTRCAALCCAARHQALKNAPKKHYSGDKTEQRKDTAALAKSSKRPPPHARAIAHPRGQQERSRRTPSVPKATLVTRGSCGVLLVVSPPSCLQSRTPRVAADASMFHSCLYHVYRTFDFARHESIIMPRQTHQSACSCCTARSYPRATLCALVIYIGLISAGACVAKSSSVGDSSLANKGSPRATPRADPL